MARPAIEFAKTVLSNKPIIAEIGVYRWEHARQMCQALDPSFIVLVDIKRQEPVSPFPYQHMFIEKSSKIASEETRDGFFDLVYIDALHDEWNMAIDIACWFPKVRPGGIICGHDYGKEEWQGIHKAVHLFFENVQTDGVDWWCVKPPDGKYKPCTK